MGDRLSAERACKDPNPIIDGRKANVNLAILGAKPRGTQGKYKATKEETRQTKQQQEPESRKHVLLWKLFSTAVSSRNICFVLFVHFKRLSGWDEELK